MDKPHARRMDLVHYMWSNKHLAVVTEIDLLMLLWTDGERHLPCDYRIYDKPNDGKTKNNHFWDLIDTPKARGFQPEYLLFYGWHSSLVNLKDRYSWMAMADKAQTQQKGQPGQGSQSVGWGLRHHGNRHSSPS